MKAKRERKRNKERGRNSLYSVGGKKTLVLKSLGFTIIIIFMYICLLLFLFYSNSSKIYFQLLTI